MKKIIFFVFVLFSSFSFSQSCTQQINGGMYQYPASFTDPYYKIITDEWVAKCTMGRISINPSTPYPEYRCHINCTACPAGTVASSEPDFRGTPIFGCKPAPISSSSSSSSSISSSSSSSAKSCPSGQTVDSNGNCNTCTPPQVKNLLTGQCEIKKECVWPEKYQSMDNTCHSNPNNCAYNTGVNVITGGMCEQGVNAAPYCPSGFTLTATNNCVPSSTSSSGSGSSSGAVSSTPSSSPSSSGSNSSSRSVATNSGDNVDQTQSTSNSQSIPVSISNSDCLNSFSTTACNVMQNCQLTFGVNNCIGVTENNNCPNSYVVNGQKMCVLSTSGQNSSSGTSAGSGSAGSASGECDSSSKNYLRCLTLKELHVPTEKGEFTGTAAAEALQEANDELNNKIESIKSEMNTVLNVQIQGSGTIEDFCSQIEGANVCFGFGKFTSYLPVIGYAILLVAYISSLFIVLRK